MNLASKGNFVELRISGLGDYRAVSQSPSFLLLMALLDGYNRVTLSSAKDRVSLKMNCSTSGSIIKNSIWTKDDIVHQRWCLWGPTGLRCRLTTTAVLRLPKFWLSTTKSNSFDAEKRSRNSLPPKSHVLNDSSPPPPLIASQWLRLER